MSSVAISALIRFGEISSYVVFILIDQSNNEKLVNSVKKKIDSSTDIDFRFGKAYIKSKAMFAIDIINANEKSEQNIKVPEYIMEGLKWIAKE